MPVPAVLAASTDPLAPAVPDAGTPALGESWIVTRAVVGETIARRILSDPELGSARAGLAAQCGTALAAIHRIPVSRVPGLVATDPLARVAEVLAEAAPSPTFELALRWLSGRQPEPTGESVVHGDFRLGNMVVGADGLGAVLDWELAHLGDPLEDLGWLCVRAWRFGLTPPVGGFGTREALVDAYEAAGGVTVDPEALRWWEAVGTLMWGVICIVQAETHRAGLVRSVELAAIGRRVAEVEHDLLLLIDPEHPPAEPSAAGDEDGAGGGGDRQPPPSATELLEAVTEWLTGDLRDATEGRTRFHARVAANVVAMVAREIRLGPAQDRTHAARLAALGAADEASLAAAIRAGALDARRAEVVASLRRSVADRLAVANPAYAHDRAP